jgi:hypothetical protein
MNSHSPAQRRVQPRAQKAISYQLVAEELKSAGQILIFGTGTGTSNEMDQFVAWLKTRHPHLAERIIGSLVVDEQHLTNDQLLAKARDFYAKT